MPRNAFRELNFLTRCRGIFFSIYQINLLATYIQRNEFATNKKSYLHFFKRYFYFLFFHSLFILQPFRSFLYDTIFMSPFHSLKSFETQNMLCRNQKRIKSYKELFKLDGFFVEKILFQKS